MRAFQSLIRVTRAAEWWEFKILPPLAAGYAASFILGGSPFEAWQALLTLVLAVIPAGIFVSVLNDLTDLEDDARAGKYNRLAGRGLTIPLLILALCLAAGSAFGWYWRGDAVVLGVYAAGWICFIAYSLPPVRLKTTGLPGALCDAIGANVVPVSLSVLLVAGAFETTAPWYTLVPVCVWSLCFGLRGIIWHQLGDAEADRVAGVKSFVLSYGEEESRLFAHRFIYPAELIAIALFLGQLPLPALLAVTVGLTLYALYTYERIIRFQMQSTIVKPRLRASLTMHEYYDVFLPVGLLLAGVFDTWMALVILAAHIVLFPARFLRVAADGVKLFDPQYTRPSLEE